MKPSKTDSRTQKAQKVAQKTQKEQPKLKTTSRTRSSARRWKCSGCLGVGLLESAYAAALGIELGERELALQREVPIAGQYKGTTSGVGYRADFIVEQSVIVEVKAIDAIADVHRAQLLSYLRLSGLKLGLLINFHAFPVSRAFTGW